MDNNEIREIEEVTTEDYTDCENEPVSDCSSNSGGAGLLLLGGALVGSLVTVGITALRKCLKKRKAKKNEVPTTGTEVPSDPNLTEVIPEDNEE